MEESGKEPSEDAELLAIFLSRHDVPCPDCGYNLRGVRLSACPECAKPIELWLRGEEPSRTAYTSGLIVISGALGFWSVVLCMIVVPWIRSGHLDPAVNFEEMWPVPAGSLTSVATLWLWLKHRRSLIWDAGKGRWIWASLAVMTSVGFVMLFFLTVK